MRQNLSIRDGILEKIKAIDIENIQLKAQLAQASERLQELNVLRRENEALKKQLALVEIDEPTSPTLQGE